MESSLKRAVPDGSWGWVVVLGSFMVHCIADGISYSFGVFVDDFVDYFECSKSAVGGLGSLINGMTFCACNVDYIFYASEQSITAPHNDTHTFSGTKVARWCSG